jgi:hypothetical protein
MVNQTKETEAKVYEVSDPRLIAYLFCCHFKLKGSPHLIGPRVFFPFEHTPKLEEEVENFDLRRTNPKIGLTQYGTKLEQVKNLIHYFRRVGDISGSGVVVNGGGSNE